MVMRGSYRLGLFALLVAIGGLLVPGGSAGADGNNSCKFDMFPTAPGGSSELAAGCFLTSAVGAAGNKYVIEDYPQAVWHSGAGRLITTTAATASGKNITSSTGHFTVADVNNQVTGTNIASNSFIVSVAGSVATLNNAVTGTVALGASLRVQSNDARTLVDATFSGSTMTSATGHFCKPTISGCGTKNDVGKTVSGTQVAHFTTIASVTDSSHVQLSATSLACPSGVSAANCQQVSLGFPQTAPPATARLLRDITVSSGNTLCSAAAAFQASDVNLAVLTTTGANPGGTQHWITAVAAAGTSPCTATQTKATLNTGGLTNGTLQSYVLGQPASDAPSNGTTVGDLISELSVNPALAPGLPACSTSNLTGSALGAYWNNPGSFNTAALGQPSGVTVPGPIIGQIVYFTGSGFDFGGYVVNVKAGTAGESDASAHFDIYLPSLLTGVAVCPNTAGVASTFRFNAATVGSQTTGSPGSVRSVTDYASGSHSGVAYEHIFKATTLQLTVASTPCAIAYPPTNGYNCGGN
jgi:hypothetical protein